MSGPIFKSLAINPVDWKMILGELLGKRGWTLRGLAAEVGVSAPTVRRLHRSTAASPSWTTGVLIMAIYEDGKQGNRRRRA